MSPTQLDPVAQALAVRTVLNILPGLQEATEHLQCSEAEAFADLLRAFGRDADADALIASHAFADSDEDDAHHALWRSINNLPPVEHDPGDDSDEKREAGL